MLLQHLYLAPFPGYYYVTACDLEKSSIFDNKSSPKSFGKSRIATPHGKKKWTRLLRVLAVQWPLQTSPVTAASMLHPHHTDGHTTTALAYRA